jgi:hypothetical protein
MPKKAVVSNRIVTVTDLVKTRAVVSGIRGMSDLILAMGSSNKDMGRQMGEFRDGDNYAACTISQWRHPRKQNYDKMRPPNIEHARQVLRRFIQEGVGSDRVNVDICANSPWRCTLEYRLDCGHWVKFDLRRARWTRCARCGGM